ncbi:hypothetical protein D3C87_2102510 [compost metagenome]
MEIEPEVVLPNVGEEFRHRRRLGSILMVFTINKFLAISCFDALVAEFQTGQFDADNGQEKGPEQCP